MNRLHVDSAAPKYQSGKWSWDEKADGLHFQQFFDLENANDRYVDTNGYRFLRTINQEEELIFRELFARPDTTFDADTVVINDVRDLVLFMMPKEFISRKFIEFMHKPAVHRLLHALIIYFEYFLRLVEFLLIRRDELAGNMAQVQSEQTNEMKRIFSTNLRLYRILVARNYSAIVMGDGELKKFYHTKEVVNISSTIKDLYFYEYFLAVSTQIVWITMHRRAYYVIEMEMNRLFRSEHFLSNCPKYLKFSPVERSLLYGSKCKIFNYRAQISPLIQELRNVADEDMPVLWIGERKYRGTDARIAQVELEYIVPGPQLHMIDVAHGILGHPKKLYDTILMLDWPSVRFANYSIQHDPYFIIRQPSLTLPNFDELKHRKMAQSYDKYYRLFRIYESCSQETLMNWIHREQIMTYYKKGGDLFNIFARCEHQLVGEEKRPAVAKIVANYFRVISRLRKKKTELLATGATTVSYKKEGQEYFFD
ncbi:PREDICTED: uncharacterized protein LOC108614018 [Drosophila arizonae]|uniref:Uncharacterized protein LOC108614018 n=1 Tax=Drosophila arizonae TaxID=7263 RepID=A0ABM1P843_DROAR|nr:PREDICTED: uncharacterized protein LOC108614018 [Drosophila arizonae]